MLLDLILYRKPRWSSFFAFKYFNKIMFFMPEDQLLEEFQRGLDVWYETRPEGYKQLVNRLYEYGTVEGIYKKGGKLWPSVLKPQIEYIATMYGREPDEVIRSLFFSVGAENFMTRLQL